MPKKPPKNGFFYFMLNYKKHAERSGKTFPGGMPEVAAAASPEWKDLPQVRKDYYNDIAKDKRNDPRPNIPKRDERRFNSQGKSFAELKMEKARAEERVNQERDFISNFVHEMNLNDLRDKLIYLIHVNIFCKTDKDVYYPAEIGLVKFSLREGIKDILHRYIDPGDIAPGYSFEVKDHSERTHKLTPQFVRSVDGTSDFSRLYREICQFLTEDEVKSEEGMPPLFTMYDNIFLNSSIDAVKGTFKSLWAHEHPSDDPDDNNWENEFKVLPLPNMFFHLKNRCMAVTNPQTIAFPNDVLARTQLQKDTYHFELDSACKFHRDEDIIAHCSQSFVLRWVYIIRDHCADLIGVDLFPKYIAPKTEIKEEADAYYDTESVTDSQYSKSWSETSDWPKKHDADSYFGGERKFKREDDYSGCKKEEERDSYSPDRRVKRETDRHSDRRVKRERDRSRSPDRRIKRERDRSRSPDRRVKREKDRSHSPDRRLKREEDRSCSERRMKPEKDRSFSPDRRLKREKDRSYSPDRRMKREKDRSYSPDRRMKREKDRSYSPERRMKRERDRTRSPDRRMKREKDRSYSPDHRMKREKDRSHSPERRMKRERDRTHSPDRRVKREKDRSYTPEHSCRRETGRYPSVERVPKRERDCSPERVIKREKDADTHPTSSHVKRESPDSSASIRSPEVHSIKHENDCDDVWYAGTFKREPCASDTIKLEKEARWHSKCETDATSSVKQEKDTSVKLEMYCDPVHAENRGGTVKEENVIKEEKEEVHAGGRVKVETVDLTNWDW